MQQRQLLPAAASVAAFLAVFSSVATAATVYYLDVPELVEVSDYVVVGALVDSDVFVGDENRITTEWTVRVDEAVVGDVGDTITFRQWAGVLDGTVEHVPGDARLELGERAVFFLRGDGAERTYLSALSQSVFHIHEEALPGNPGDVVDLPTIVVPVLGGEPATRVGGLPLHVPVSRDFDELAVFSRTDLGPELIEPAREVYTLGDLLDDVRRAAGGDR